MSARRSRAGASAICAMVAIACSEPTAPVAPEPPMAAPITEGVPAAETPVAFAQAARAPTASSAVDDALDRVIATFPESSSAAELRRILRLLSGALAGSDRVRSQRLLDESHQALRVLQSTPASSGREAELAAIALALDAVPTPSHGDGP
jgi:hypothetical protein